MQERHHVGSASRFLVILLGVSVFATQCFAQKPSTPKMQGSNRGTLLEKLSWDEAEHVLTPNRVVVIALGAELKEHGNPRAARSDHAVPDDRTFGNESVTGVCHS